MVLALGFCAIAAATRAHRARGDAKLKGDYGGFGLCLGALVHVSATISIDRNRAAGRRDVASLPRARGGAGGFAAISGRVHGRIRGREFEWKGGTFFK